jgi:hypothetical protein
VVAALACCDCEAITDAMLDAFAGKVASGECDDAGFTPADRRSVLARAARAARAPR